jgi:hypothetical protein
MCVCNAVRHCDRNRNCLVVQREAVETTVENSKTFHENRHNNHDTPTRTMTQYAFKVPVTKGNTPYFYRAIHERRRTWICGAAMLELSRVRRPRAVCTPVAKGCFT